MTGALDATTDGELVVGVVAGVVTVAVVPEVFAVPADSSSDSVVVAGTVVAGVTVVVWALVALAVVAVCVAARPAKSPVPARAPASDQLVNCLIRARPASRSLRLRGVTARVLMTTIVVDEL
jgi:hypothetical protein